MSNIRELSQDICGPFEVIGQSGDTGKKTWHLRQTQSSHEYSITPKTAADWPKQKKKALTGPCIILSMDGPSMVVMHLSTGKVFIDGTPPTRLKLS